MDSVYNKYIAFNKLKQHYTTLSIEHQIQGLKLTESQDKILFLEANNKALVTEFDKRDLVKDDKHKKETALIKSQLKKARLNQLKIGGIGAIIIASIILVK